MPIYEYRCSKCGDFEAMQKMSDKPLTTCPTCRRKVTKLISSTSFQLKGSGWYITDYARKDKGGGKSESGDAGESKSEAKSESTTSASSDAARRKDRPRSPRQMRKVAWGICFLWPRSTGFQPVGGTGFSLFYGRSSSAPRSCVSFQQARAKGPCHHRLKACATFSAPR